MKKNIYIRLRIEDGGLRAYILGDLIKRAFES